MWSRASSFAGLLVAGASLVCGTARADGPPAPDDPVNWLASRSELQGYDRIAVLAGDAGQETGQARDAVARVLAGAGHDVATLAGASAGIDRVGTDRQKLIAACRGFDTLAIVRNSTEGPNPTIVVSLYSPRGDLVATLDGPGLPPPAWPPRAPVAADAASAPRLTPGNVVNPLRGPALYEAMGRPDLASRYRRRRAAKIAVISAGGGVAVAGIALTLGDLVLTGIDNALRCWTLGSALDPTSAPPCQRQESNPWPFVTMIGVGMATAMVGAMIQVDPLTPTERRAVELQIGAAPAALGDGGSLILRGRF